ncbi:DUF1761 domain-containing protein [Hyphococcus sp.]|uniref:DUF1761 domain-containing protein n=1 Tax=Hyphococcus sp. TaxID=2038636 RepID=UPI00207EFC36|nr:MAG: hypothetical protein DHS20C04_16160 [Marinicaulis sp.]
MPKILGLNLIAVIAASVAFFLVGYLWYGVMFSDAWMAAAGIPSEAADAESPVWMAGGFLITLLQVIGLGLVLKWKGDATPTAAATTAAVLWFFIALPFCHYSYLYMPGHNATMLMIDASHLLVGWVVSALILRLIK